MIEQKYRFEVEYDILGEAIAAHVEKSYSSNLNSRIKGCYFMQYGEFVPQEAECIKRIIDTLKVNAEYLDPRNIENLQNIVDGLFKLTIVPHLNPTGLMSFALPGSYSSELAAERLAIIDRINSGESKFESLEDLYEHIWRTRIGNDITHIDLPELLPNISRLFLIDENERIHILHRFSSLARFTELFCTEAGKTLLLILDLCPNLNYLNLENCEDANDLKIEICNRCMQFSYDPLSDSRIWRKA